MGLIILYFLGALSLSFLCSVLEAVLLSTPLSYISMRCGVDEAVWRRIFWSDFCNIDASDTCAFRNHPKDNRRFLLAFACHAVRQDYPCAYLPHLSAGIALRAHHQSVHAEEPPGIGKSRGGVGHG